jgi:hypothetical protein
MKFRNLAATMGINSKEAQAALASFRQLSAQTKEINTAIRPTETAFSGLTSQLKGMATGFLGVTAVAGGVVSFLKNSFEAAAQEERQIRRLSAAFDDNKEATERILRLRERMKETTMFSEDEITEAITMARELGNNEINTVKLTEAALAWAKVTGRDITRVMVKLNKDMEEGGNLVDIYHKKYIKFLTEGAGTTEEKVDKMKKKWEDFLETIGTGLLKAFNVLAESFDTGDQEIKNQIESLEKLQKVHFLEARDVEIKTLKNELYFNILKKDTQAEWDRIKAAKEGLKTWTVTENKHDAIVTKLEEEKAAVDKARQALVEYVREQATSFIIPVSFVKPVEPMKPIEHKQVTTGKAPTLGGLMMTDITSDLKAALLDAENFNKAIQQITASVSWMGTNFQMVLSGIGGLIKDVKSKFVDGWKSAVDNVASLISGLVGMITDLFTQQYDTQLMQLDSEYERRKEYIDTHIKDETAKKKAIDKLEADTNKRRKELLRDQAKAQKTASLIQAIVNGALAIVMAYATQPVWLGIVMGTIMAALVAVQIAAIASQPLPALAKGGLATAPTMAIVGDNPNANIDPEVISPLSRLREFFGMNESGLLTARVSGDDLLFVLDKATVRRGRVV